MTIEEKNIIKSRIKSLIPRETKENDGFSKNQMQSRELFFRRIQYLDTHFEKMEFETAFLELSRLFPEQESDILAGMRLQSAPKYSDGNSTEGYLLNFDDFSYLLKD